MQQANPHFFQAAQIGPAAVQPDAAVRANALELEIQIVADAIVARDQQSSQIKQWCISLWMASWAVLAFDARDLFSTVGSGAANLNQVYLVSVSLGAVALCLMFFFLDLINKRNQYKFLWRGRVIHQFLNNQTDAAFAVYDPGGATDKFSGRTLKFGSVQVTYDDYTSLWNVARQVTGLAVFYGILATVSLIPVFLAVYCNLSSQAQ